MTRQDTWPEPKLVAPWFGLRPGDVELTADGAALRVVPVQDDALVEAEGRLVIPLSGTTIDDELLRTLGGSDRR